MNPLVSPIGGALWISGSQTAKSWWPRVLAAGTATVVLPFNKIKLRANGGTAFTVLAVSGPVTFNYVYTFFTPGADPEVDPPIRTDEIVTVGTVPQGSAYVVSYRAKITDPRDIWVLTNIGPLNQAADFESDRVNGSVRELCMDLPDRSGDPPLLYEPPPPPPPGSSSSSTVPDPTPPIFDPPLGNPGDPDDPPNNPPDLPPPPPPPPDGGGDDDDDDESEPPICTTPGGCSITKQTLSYKAVYIDYNGDGSIRRSTTITGTFTHNPGENNRHCGQYSGYLSNNAIQERSIVINGPGNWSTFYGGTHTGFNSNNPNVRSIDCSSLSYDETSPSYKNTLEIS